tara:strand:- start:644 stop:1306 length:663 start_codon:yes stop_codon:yes gene_type:complete
MKRLEHKGKSCNQVHPHQDHKMWETEELEGKKETELDELVDFDGSLLNSKIPLGINKSNKISRSTSDDMVKTAHQKGNGLGYYYKRYWGESYQGAALGDNEEIDLMTGQETIDHFEDDYGLSLPKAIDKARKAGKKVDGTKTELDDDKQRLVELSSYKMRDMLEVLLSKPTDKEDFTPSSKEVELHDITKSNPILDKMASRFKRACDAQGIDPEDILNNI